MGGSASSTEVYLPVAADDDSDSDKASREGGPTLVLDLDCAIPPG